MSMNFASSRGMAGAVMWLRWPTEEDLAAAVMSDGVFRNIRALPIVMPGFLTAPPAVLPCHISGVIFEFLFFTVAADDGEGCRLRYNFVSGMIARRSTSTPLYPTKSIIPA